MSMKIPPHAHEPSVPESGNEPYCVVCGQAILAPLDGRPAVREQAPLAPWSAS